MEFQKLIITHPHADHMGELNYLVNHFKINTLIINKSSFSKEKLNSIINYLKINNVKILDAQDIKTINFKNSTVQFLNSIINSSNDLNEHSIVLIIRYEGKNILLTGDATKNNETLLLQRYRLPKIDILKVGHHGSKTSSSIEFLRKIKPNISVISSGKNNRYHLPHKSTLEKLHDINSKIYNTQDYGEIEFILKDKLDIRFSNNKKLGSYN